MNRIIMFIIIGIMLFIFGFGFYYIGRKLYCWLYLMTPGMHLRILLGICAIFVLSVFLSFMPFDVSVKKILVWFAWFLIGLYVYFLLTYFLFDIIIIFGRLFRIIPTPYPHKFIIAVSWIVVCLVALVTCYGIFNGRSLKQVSYNVQINKETSLKTLNVVMIADLHLWYVNDEKWLAKVAEKINGLEPDIVCIAGDIFNDNFNAIKYPGKAKESLLSIKSTYGVYACLGNHDGGKTYEEMLRFLEESNVVLLQDEYRVIDNKFIIAGRKDSSPIGNQGEPRKDYELVSGGMNENLPIIVIDHNPANLKEYNKKADLILAGHTHKGQIFPADIITHFMHEYNYGHYNKEKDSFQAVVTSGVGVWGPPVRIGTNNEVVKIIVGF